MTEPLPVPPSILEQLLGAVRRRLVVVVLCVLVAGGAALGISLLSEKEYSASASLLFRDPAFDQKLFGSSFVERSGDAAREAATNVSLVSLETVADRTAARASSGLSGEEVSRKIEVEAEGQSDVVSVTATDQSPEFAARLANLFATEYIDFRREADRSKIREAQRLLRGSVDELGPVERSRADGRALREQLKQLKVLAALQTGNAELVQQANVPTTPSSPKPVRNTALGVVLGLLVGVGMALLFDRLDRRLRDRAEVEGIFERPVLATVPQSRALGASSGAMDRPAGPEQEAFRLLRANLRYFNLKSEIRSVLITSSGPREGKTTVAWNLAAAAAGERVLLVEADFRRPTMASHAGLLPPLGLSNVLAGQVPWRKAVQEVVVRIGAHPSDPGHAHSMTVLFSGPLPPNPMDLLESERMRDLLDEAGRDFDLVVIDTPPTSVVSDAIPLVTRVDGVVVVSRLGTATRDATRALRSQLDNLGARTLGVVINSAGAETRYYRPSNRDLRLSPGDLEALPSADERSSPAARRRARRS